MKLYVIRHGQTDWNKEYKVQGHTDIPLNENGISMAKKAHDDYKDMRFDICYCSPLTRARQTAEYLLEGRDIDIIIDDRLQEVSFGDYEGNQKIFQYPNHPLHAFFKDPANYVTADSAESFDHLYARTGSFLEEHVYPHMDEDINILIVGHGAMNLSIINRIKNIPISNFWDNMQKNCEIMELL